MNVNFAAWAAAADYFAPKHPEFKTNMVRYYEYLREQDITLTHAISHVQESSWRLERRPDRCLFSLQSETSNIRQHCFH
jgi:aromatic ring hydroxylase